MTLLSIAQCSRAISEGEARPGERLPPARDPAAVLEVNTNTVLRALRALRDEGLLEFAEGEGSLLSAMPRRRARSLRRLMSWYNSLAIKAIDAKSSSRSSRA
jgi:DNA-binding transcriptional regulator YhcF (GntR family)